MGAAATARPRRPRASPSASTFLSLFFLPFDSWCATGWAHWPEIALARKAWVRALVGGCRAAADARVLHSYGVFPPASNPPMRFAPALEGSLDGVTWRRYEWKWLPSSPSSSPRFVAPHHPRLDHSLFYTSFGTGPDNFLATINAPRPYGLSHHSMLHRLGARLLDGAPLPVRRLFRHDPFPPTGPPPRFVRVRLLLLRPHDLGDATSTGGWWAESGSMPCTCPRSRRRPSRASSRSRRRRCGSRRPTTSAPATPSSSTQT